MQIRRIVSMLTATACLGLVGCGQSPSEKLIGKWQCNPVEQDESDEKPAEEVGVAEGLFAGAVEAFGQMTTLEIEFQEDKTLSADWLLLSAPGTIYWSVTETDGNRVTLQLSGEEGKNAVDAKITFVDGDHFRFGPPGAAGKTLLFERVAKK